MLGRLASVTDPQQLRALHCFVAPQSLTYTGRFWLVLHWQGTVSSDHLCGAETTCGQICIVCKKDSYQQGRCIWVTWAVPLLRCVSRGRTSVSESGASAEYTAYAACPRDYRLWSRLRTRESGAPWAQVLRRAGLRHDPDCGIRWPRIIAVRATKSMSE
jgi:hypothetical protein